jgi:hypothetical protein
VKFVVCGSNRENLDEDVILMVDAENGSEALKKAGDPLPMFTTGCGPLVVIKEDEK